MFCAVHKCTRKIIYDKEAAFMYGCADLDPSAFASALRNLDERAGSGESEAGRRSDREDMQDRIPVRGSGSLSKTFLPFR